MSRTVLLLLLVCALAGTAGLVLRHGEANEDRMPAPPQTSSPITAPMITTAPLDAQAGRDAEWVRIILDRPLFTAGRRPPAGAAAARPSAAPMPRVAGIIVEGGQRRVIFAASNEKAYPLVLQEGAELNGFKIVSIEAGQVTLQGPNGLRVLRPSFDPNPAPVPAPPQPGLPSLQNLPGLTGIPGLVPPGGVTR